MKTVGVLGGIGPQATMEFEARFHRLCQERIPQRFNSGYPPLVVAYHRHPPIRFDESERPLVPYLPDPRLLETARRLGAWVDLIAITSNLPHLFREDIARVSGRTVLDMIGLAVREVESRGWRRVGVMGFGEPMVYTQPLDALGIACEILAPEARPALDEAIVAVMEGAVTGRHRDTAARALSTLRERGVDGAILGCTEIPLLLGMPEATPDLVDPLGLLVDAAVRAALETS